jgi:hypothetical protein
MNHLVAQELSVPRVLSIIRSGPLGLVQLLVEPFFLVEVLGRVLERVVVIWLVASVLLGVLPLGA